MQKHLFRYKFMTDNKTIIQQFQKIENEVKIHTKHLLVLVLQSS